MVQRGVNRELAFEDLAIDHCNQRRAEIVANLDEFAALNLLVVLNRFSLLALQVLVLLVECCIES